MKNINKKVFAVIVAGGSGTRMGGAIPKQYIEIGGKPILAYTVQQFLQCSSFEKVLVLCPNDWVDDTRQMMETVFLSQCQKVQVLSGGSDRNGTIMNAISYIEKSNGTLEDVMLVTHDGVRPFVTKEMIEAQIQCVCQDNICEAVIPATDTLIVSRKGKTLDGMTDRSQMYQVQTPQSFPALLMKAQYEELTLEQKKKMTDAIGIFASHGETIKLLPGDVQNIKITYPHDLVVAEAILTSRE